VKLKDEEKIKAIYSATLRLFETQGIAGINMANVAKEAGIATGTVYIYFKSKEELLNTLFKETKIRSAEKIAKGYSTSDLIECGCNISNIVLNTTPKVYFTSILVFLHC